MATNGKKTIHQYMRNLHRDIGFFVIGLTLIYAFSGILLIYRETGFLKSNKIIERKLEPNMDPNDLGRALHIRDFKPEKTEGDTIYVRNGTYNKVTGMVRYSEDSLPSFLEKFNRFHKSSSKSIFHIFCTIYAISLLFLAISSFWMFKPGSKQFRRGLILTISGIVLTLVLLFI